MDEKQNMKYGKKRRKEWKKSAKHILKTHYVLLVVIGLIAGIFRVEDFTNWSDYSDYYDTGVKVVNSQKAEDSTNGKINETNTKTSEEMKAQEEESPIDKVWDAVLGGKFKTGKQISDNEVKNAEKSTAGKNLIAGRSRGALAGVVNKIASGSLLVRIAEGINSIVKNGKLAGGIAIALVLVIYFLIWMFLLNPFEIIVRRIFLEAREYENVPVGRSLFLITVKRWGKSAKSMLRVWIYTILWRLTIIGGIIKYYSYWCVPYILAENPDMTGREALDLSRKMMNGRKWETFKYDLTFIGWFILQALFHIVGALFTIPYKASADANMYQHIREEAKKANIPGTEKLNDEYLFKKADKEFLEEKYSDILYRKALAKSAEVKLTGVKKFFVENFGLWLGSDKAQKQYEEVELEMVNLERAELAAHGKIYPERCNPLWDVVSEDRTPTKNNYLKSYSIWSMIAFFAIFAFIGWSWEVILHLVQDGVFINRGALHGPWLPIYGTGGVMILLLLKRFRKSPILLGFTTFVLCGVVEYFTSYFMEMSKGIRWWDYTDYFLNLNGRICAEGLAVFVIAGFAAVYVIAPALDRMLQKINIKVLIVACCIYTGLFVTDAIYSHYYPNIGKGITDYQAFKNVK